MKPQTLDTESKILATLDELEENAWKTLGRPLQGSPVHIDQFFSCVREWQKYNRLLPTDKQKENPFNGVLSLVRETLIPIGTQKLQELTHSSKSSENCSVTSED